MTGSMQLIREFCDGFIKPEKATRTRIVISLIYNSILPSSPFHIFSILHLNTETRATKAKS